MSTSEQKLEAAVERVVLSITRLVRTAEGEGKHLTADQIAKAFSFLALTADAGRQKALAALNASALSSFSLANELPQLPTFASIQAESLRTTTLGPTHRTAPSLVAPQNGRQSVEDLGGRFCEDARDAAKAQRVPGDDRHLSTATGGDDEVAFLDEDERDPDAESED